MNHAPPQRSFTAFLMTIPTTTTIRPSLTYWIIIQCLDIASQSTEHHELLWCSWIIKLSPTPDFGNACRKPASPPAFPSALLTRNVTWRRDFRFLQCARGKLALSCCSWTERVKAGRSGSRYKLTGSSIPPNLSDLYSKIHQSPQQYLQD